MTSKFTEFVKQNWIIFLLLPISVLFFLFGPKLIASLFVDEGKPIRKNIEFPDVDISGHYRYSIDYLSTYEENQDLYLLAGWAFSTLNQDYPTNQFKTEILLYNDAQNYLFESRTSDRKDVKQTLSNLSLDIQQPGFSVIMNMSSISNGDYCVGIIFTDKENNIVQFFSTNHLVSRSPNTLTLSSADELVCDPIKIETNPLLERISFRSSTGAIKYSIDTVSILEEQNNIMKISGWAFSTTNPGEPTDNYKTEVILFSNTSNYLFETKPKIREDVVNAFSESEWDIVLPGFNAYINKEDLFQGDYCIALKLSDEQNKKIEFVNTKKVLSNKANEIFLQEEPDPQCEIFYQTYLEQPAN
jgi:hypothetical protein